ncbi:hypothetical protein [Spirosoma pomorum]
MTPLKWFLAVLALAGLGGLVYWLLTAGGSAQTPTAGAGATPGTAAGLTSTQASQLEALTNQVQTLAQTTQPVYVPVPTPMPVTPFDYLKAYKDYVPSPPATTT